MKVLLIGLVVLILWICISSERFTWGSSLGYRLRSSRRPSFQWGRYSSARSRPRSSRRSQLSSRAQRSTQRYPAPTQGLSWGHAYNPSTGTWAGVNTRSSIAGLQKTYQHIFAPRSSSQMSGQQQRRQHLAPGGLGHTGWTFPRRP